MLYNQLMSVAYVPCAWKSAVVEPVFKKGVSGSVQNYHPISLTCVVSKIMERIVSDRIRNHLLANNILHSAQHGFLKHRSTITKLIECFNDWIVCAQDRCQMTVVYIDFREAFDVVSHEKLFRTILYHYRICGNALLCLKNFFTGRTYKTRVNSSLADLADLSTDIIQGSGIGPVMFLWYINELIALLETWYCS